MTKRLATLACTLLLSTPLWADAPQPAEAAAKTDADYPHTVLGAFKAAHDGHHQRAIEIFEDFANRGDSDAMIQLGMRYQHGDGVEPDYKKAMDWYMKAMKKADPEAPTNIGTLYRDGQGVEQNRKIAYALFVYTNMYGLGGRATQERAIQNIRAENEIQPVTDIQEALCYTWPYVKAYIENRGPVEIKPEYLPSAKNRRIKDFDWWNGVNRQRMQYNCPDPWHYPMPEQAQPSSSSQ